MNLFTYVVSVESIISGRADRGLRPGGRRARRPSRRRTGTGRKACRGTIQGTRRKECGQGVRVDVCQIYGWIEVEHWRKVVLKRKDKKIKTE